MMFVFIALFITEIALAQAPSPSPVSSPVPVVVAPVIPTVSPTILVAEPAAPPVWAQQLLVAAEKLPVVGPIVSKVIFYGGMLASILTLLAGSFMALLKILSVVSSLSGLAAFAQKVQSFQDGKIMYYLKYLSMFNAKRPYPGEVIQPLYNGRG